MTKKRNRRRSGAAAVECALVLPLLLMLLVGSIEFGSAINSMHTLSEAARNGARVYSMRTTKTEQDVKDAVAKVMSDAGIDNYTVSLNPDPSTTISHLSAVTVTVTVPFDQINPAPWFLGGKTLTGSCTMPADEREYGSGSTSSGSSSTGGSSGGGSWGGGSWGGGGWGGY